jgi:hypothetical protein
VIAKPSLDCHCLNAHANFLNSIIGMKAENESSYVKPIDKIQNYRSQQPRNNN